jgi:hypothetical protein
MNGDNTVPLLDLAPKLKRPLQLWNPLDYLRLLYWTFFFPQAIRWYVKEFGKPGYRDNCGTKKVKDIITNDPVQSRLIYQSNIILVATTLGIAWSISISGIPIYWSIVAFGVTYALMGIYAISSTSGVTVGVVIAVVGGLLGSLSMSLLIGIQDALMAVVLLGIMAGVVPYLIKYKVGAISLSVVGDVAVGLTISIVISFILAGIAWIEGDLQRDIPAFIIELIGLFALLSTIINVTTLRLIDYIFLGLTGTLFWNSKHHPKQFSHLSFLPLPKIQQQFVDWLEEDWISGIHNANQMLVYTQQFIPVVKAINIATENSTANTLLSRISSLANRTFDSKLLQLGSANLDNLLQYEINKGFIPLPAGLKKKWQSKYNIAPRLDTPARAACAGFWYWHEKEAVKATEAFAVVREMRHGPELFGIADSISKGLKAESMQNIADWAAAVEWLRSLPHPELRPGTLEALRTLRSVSVEAEAAQKSQAPLNRSAAINRAVGVLTQLAETDESSYPQAEWSLVKDMAKKWQDIYVKEGTTAGEEVLRQPVHNPYHGYSGLPVIGTTFTGRDDIMRRIETHWATAGQPAAIILYGHRRMGKTSILRNLAGRTGSDSLYIYLDMQQFALIEHTGQLLLDFTETIHRAAKEAGLAPGPEPDESQYTNMSTGRRQLDRLLQHIGTQMTDPAHPHHPKRMIMAIDEFERIESGIKAKRIDSGFLLYLRSINQQTPWLGLIFAGLHTLEEMGMDYQSAFFGQAEYIRVGYLDRDAAIKLICQPHPDFSLEYEPALRDELFRLSGGQPYLLQRLCWELVNRWNDEFLKHGETPPRTLTVPDLKPVLTPDFFQSAGYYFDGVWSNVTENERALMSILANPQKTTYSLQELTEAANNHTGFNTPADLDDTLKLLKRHDVIAVSETDASYRIASELMRQWIYRLD